MHRVRGLLVGGLIACGGVDEPVDIDAVQDDARPSKRSEILGVPDVAHDRMIIFGGNDGPIVSQVPQGNFLDETWAFTPGVGWEELAADVTDKPKARGRYAVGLDEAGGRMLVFGGRFRKAGQTGDYRLFNDLWAFDFEDETWTQLHAGRGDAPSPRYYPGGAWDPVSETFWIWGGATNENPLNILPDDALWSWTEADGWTEVPTTGDAPSTRAFFTMAYDAERNRLVLFGGQPGDFVSLAFHDTYALDLDTATWSLLNDGEGKAPSTRMHGHLVVDAPRDRYLLFGGHTDIGDANDLWAFDPETDAWSLITRGDRFTNNGLGCEGNPSEVPADYVVQDLDAPERRHRGMAVPYGDNLWVFGGIHAECSDQLDDTWRYDLTTDTWTEILEARTGESCERRGENCACLCL